MADINLVNPTSNQILIYNELQGVFENADLTPDLIKNFSALSGAVNIGSVNSIPVYNDTLSGSLRFRGLIGHNGISVANVGSDVRISFDGNATTLGGLDRSGYVQVSNNLSDVNAVQARANLNVMSTNESFDNFLEANASNIPDNDNLYDFGSNGRRFANMFAVNFHGNASSASIASKLARNGATNGQVLVWRSQDNQWKPEDLTSNRLATLGDVDLSNIQHESVLVYNSVRNIWESVPASFFGGGDGVGSGDGVTMNAVNTGAGLGVYSTTLGNTHQFKSLRAGTNITLSYNFDNSEIVIDAQVPQSTNDLVEGSSNLYYTRNRLIQDLATLSIQDLGNTDTSLSPTNGQAPVWDGSKWTWVTVNSGLNSTDNLPEGISNFYFTQGRVNTAIQNFFNSNGVTLNELSDVSVTPSNNQFLKFDASTSGWVSDSIKLSLASDVNLTGAVEGSILRWDASQNAMVIGSIPNNLEDFGSTANSMAFNQASFDLFFNQKSTLDLSEDSTRQFLNQANLTPLLNATSIAELSDVNIGGISNGNILVWDGSRFVPASSESLNVNVSVSMRELTDVDSIATANITNNQVLAYDAASQLFKPTDVTSRVQDATDVDASGIQNGHGLVWDTNRYVSKMVVTIDGTPTNGDLLQYDSSIGSFVTIAGGNIASSIFDLDGTEYTGLDNNDILVYDDASSKFVNRTLTMDLLDDVGSKINGATLVYNITSDTHEYMRYQLTSLLDVDVTNLSNNDTIVYNALSGRFENHTFALSSLSDVDSTSVTDGQFLRFNANTGIHEYVTLNTQILSDIEISSPQVGQVLYYNGTSFTNTTMSLNDLGDCTIQSVQTNDILSADASGNFSNKPLTLSMVSDIVGTPETSQVLSWNGTEYSFTDALTYNPLSLGVNDVPAWNGSGFSFNSIEQIIGLDVSSKQDGYVLTFEAATGNMVFKPQAQESSGGVVDFIASQGQTVFPLLHDGIAMVFANGILLPSSELDLSNTDQVTLTTPRNEDDVIRVMVIGDSNAATISTDSLLGDVTEIITTAGQTTLPVEHEMFMFMLFANGVLLPPNAYSLPDDNTIELNNARNDGDVLTILILR